MKKEKKPSIQFGPIKYDQGHHLLQTVAKQGKNSIRCSITEDVFTELYKCQPNEKELTKSFKAHEPELCRALQVKMQQENKQWKPNEEIRLNAQDLRQFQ